MTKKTDKTSSNKKITKCAMITLSGGLIHGF
jgi:hypothetical protein